MLGECDYHPGRVATPDTRAGYEHNLVSLPSITLASLLFLSHSSHKLMAPHETSSPER